MHTLNKHNILKEYWGFDTFRSPQEQVIDAVLEGKDVLTILPTGGGKSLCYQLPSVILPGTALVISPLIALMNDQVQSLVGRNIRAAAIHSGMTRSEVQEIYDALLHDNIKLLYVSPERLVSEEFLQIATQIEWSVLVIDEAHCISEWGHDFRPLYRNIHMLYDLLSFRSKIALTASATARVREDICRQLAFADPSIFRQSIYRANISYSVSTSEHKFSDILSVTRQESEIIYCPTRIKTEEIAAFFNQHQKEAVAFHAGLPHHWKKEIQKKWTHSDKLIMAATNAFGMGIDKPNVRKVIHFAPPYSLESYYQEAGRAGRDGQPAAAHLFYNPRDLEQLESDTERRFPAFDLIRESYEAICNSLKIGVGTGIETLYFPDPVQVARNFGIPLLPLLHAIKIIEQNGYWSWQHDDHMHHSARFLVQRQDLEALKDYHPQQFEFAIQLLRMYGGIMHFETRIHIADIASFVHTTYEEIVHLLQWLDRQGVISYKPAQSGSSLYFLENRVPAGLFHIDRQHLQFLKERHKDKVKAMIAYIQNDQTCRSIQLGRYFGENNLEPCHQCDVCIGSSVGPTDSIEIYNQLMKMKQKQSSVSLMELWNQLPQFEKKQISRQLQKMSEEGLVQIQGTNIIFAT
ncbi:MAG: RecQ family ATP-dependent DNA helicase [Taibaiella sp.]|nr:RecQ family ATP-dependent DNA helicase [Taibaiella sp.]MBX9449182.1 RecQ family ATP-dependent DNA helicase [Taibaiella sp.]